VIETGISPIIDAAARISMDARKEIRPQPGMQMEFLKCPADICIVGGTKGPGKSYALLMEPLRHCIPPNANPGFGAVIFRRTAPQITNEGGLWDTSNKIYPYCGGIPKVASMTGMLKWEFPSGARIRFAHMQYEQDRFQWDGAQIPMIGFDQLETFSWKMFTYMLSINRSTCGVRPYIRATCNPVPPPHWLRHFLSWWIGPDGFVIPERSGVIRWFTIRKNEVFWADKREDLIRKFGPTTKPLCFTFILGLLRENKILLEEDPDYEAKLQALTEVEQLRLTGDRGGNWDVRETAGTILKRIWFETVDAAPSLIDHVRYWDRAGTEAKKAKERTSWTAGCRMGKDIRGVYYITGMERFQGHPLEVELALKNTAAQDGRGVRIGVEQDPGQAGKAEALYQVRNLAGYNVMVNPVRESKGTRVNPFAAQAKAGNVKLVRGTWNEAFLNEAENFDGTEDCISDQIDACSGAFFLLTSVKTAGVW
jgi:predicted phage terminase large subunit-like protein